MSELPSYTTLYRTALPEHAELLDPEFAQANPELVPAVLVGSSDEALGRQRPAGITAYGGAALFIEAAAGCLSDRLLQVASLAMTGVPNDDIGSALYLAEDTVKTHLRRLNSKLLLPDEAGTSTRSGLFARMLATTDSLKTPLMKVVKPSNPEIFGKLTKRELEVLGYVARGLSNEETAVPLGLRPLTVKAHLARIAGRLGTGDRTLIGTGFLMFPPKAEEVPDILHSGNPQTYYWPRFGR